MKMTAVLGMFCAALLAASGIQAQQGSFGGKWVADGPAQGNALGALPGGGGAGISSSAGSSSSIGGQRGPFPGANPGLYPRMSPRIAELDLTVDLIKEAVSGSIYLPGEGKTSCGKLKIVEGHSNGRTLSFTTYRTINGSNIPTRWTGEIIGGALSLQTVDTLPCNTNARPGLNSMPSLQPASSLLYRRGDMDTRKASQPMSASGRWWTRDNGQVTALSFAVASKGQITGSVNVCGDAESRIENGSVSGRNITFETFSKTSTFKVRQRWTGNIIDDNRLTLSSQVSTECPFPPAISVVFQRSR